MNCISNIISKLLGITLDLCACSSRTSKLYDTFIEKHECSFVENLHCLYEICTRSKRITDSNYNKTIDKSSIRGN